MSTGSRLHTIADLATGGMGRVYVAVRMVEGFQRLYAVKRLLPQHANDPEVRAMFVDEARVAGHLQHPNVVGVVDTGTDEDGPFLVMEYVDGVSASTLICAGRRQGGLPLQVALDVGAQAARGLAAAHDATDAQGAPLGIIHRDVSPQNILIGLDGAARLTDFGIARAVGRSTKTSTGVLKGKIGYMAPEQLRFEPPSHRTDLFAFGVVLFELLTCRRLYPAGEDGLEGPKRILTEAPPDLTDHLPQAPPELVELLFELLAKEPEDRPPSAKEVSHRLETILADVRACEARIDLGEYVALQTEGDRTERSARIREGLTALSSPSADLGRLPIVAPARSRWLAVAVASFVVILGGGAAVTWMILDPASSGATASDATAERVRRDAAASPPDDLPGATTSRTSTSSTPTSSTPTSSTSTSSTSTSSTSTSSTQTSLTNGEPVDDLDSPLDDRTESPPGARERARRRARRHRRQAAPPVERSPSGVPTWGWDRR